MKRSPMSSEYNQSPNKSLQATRGGALCSASRFTLVCPACLRSGLDQLHTMQAQSPTSVFWIVGRTRRERVVTILAIFSFCGGLLWALINDLSYGSEGADVQVRVNTNGLFPISTVLVVFFSLAASSAVCALLFCFFRRSSK